jgi:hypothetical protein
MMQAGLKNFLHFTACSGDKLPPASMSLMRAGALIAMIERTIPQSPAKIEVRALRLIGVSSNYYWLGKFSQ